MNNLKSFTLSTTGFMFTFLMFMGIYNSVQVNSSSFMQQTTDIRFIKRLDEIKGKVTLGRMAASTVKWESLSDLKKIEENKDKPVIQKVETVSKVDESLAQNLIPEPAVDADLNMKLSNVFFKKPLKDGSFLGSAKTVDGVIEEVYVELPGGKIIEINTRDRMVGNVFQYEDTVTRELKSGMFYEVKKGTYMITLTNDSEYAGLRLEFKAENNAEVAYGDEYNQDINWGINTQNPAESNTTELPTADNSNLNDYSDSEYGQTDAQEKETYGFELSS